MTEPKNSPYIERKIIIGMIVSKKYLNAISDVFEGVFLDSKEAKRISSWCLQYFKKYNKAPKKQIEAIFMSKVDKLQKDEAQIIEIILESLSKDYSSKKINLAYLTDETFTYFKKQKLKIELEKIQDEIEQDNLTEAEALIYNFNTVEQITSNAVTPLSSLEQIKAAHEDVNNPLINFGNTAIGYLMNDSMVREGLIGLIGQNKGGKTWVMSEIGLRGAGTGSKVAFFQGGDLSQKQFERRLSIHYAKKSDKKKYCGQLFIPTLDCVKNLNGSCGLKAREGGEDAAFPFADVDYKDIRCACDARNPITHEKLIKAYYDYREHCPCYNCLRFGNSYLFQGTTWYKKRKKVDPLTWKESYNMRNKYKRTLKNMKLITYPNEGLTIAKINAELDLLEKEGFTSDVVIIDYADILEPDKDTLSSSTRDQENKKWQRARRMSQERKVLVIMATQSDAQGFDAPLLGRKNFNEDRRKLDHMTALFGLNMQPNEKKRGLLRINSILNREEEGNEIVTVLHRLQIGRPILGSYF